MTRNRSEALERLDTLFDQVRGFSNSDRLYRELYFSLLECEPYLEDSARSGLLWMSRQGSLCEEKYYVEYNREIFTFTTSIEPWETQDVGGRGYEYLAGRISNGPGFLNVYEYDAESGETKSILEKCFIPEMFED